MTAALNERNLELKEINSRMATDLQRGARIQAALIPSVADVDCGPIDIDVLALAKHHVDGDFLQVVRSSAHTLDLVLGDVMGKGVPAAMVATSLSAELRRQLSHLTRRGTPPPIDVVIDAAHRELGRSLDALGIFVSLFYCRIDWFAGSLEYVDCGSTKPLLASTTESPTALAGEDPPFGVTPERAVQLGRTHYSPDDILLLYSDGLLEATNSAGVAFGSARIEALARALTARDAAAGAAHVADTLSTYRSGRENEDDVTVCVLRLPTPMTTSGMPAECTMHAAHLAALPDVRTQIEQVAGNLAPDVRARCVLSVSEAFANLVRHAGLPESASVEVAASADAKSLRVSILDQANSFEPPGAQSMPSPEERQVGGYGLPLLHELTSELSYSPRRGPDGWNRLQMTID
jgi:serine phosphatase RsbU (regulator of sigma subunit)/anti-sigma regulatory factor (Ser/Thr protein kinase)